MGQEKPLTYQKEGSYVSAFSSTSFPRHQLLTPGGLGAEEEACEEVGQKC